MKKKIAKRTPAKAARSLQRKAKTTRREIPASRATAGPGPIDGNGSPLPEEETPA